MTDILRIGLDIVGHPKDKDFSKIHFSQDALRSYFLLYGESGAQELQNTLRTIGENISILWDHYLEGNQKLMGVIASPIQKEKIMEDGTKTKTGDVVRLISGGPDMTVAFIDRGTSIIRCVWFNEKGELLSGNFEAGILNLILASNSNG